MWKNNQWKSSIKITESRRLKNSEFYCVVFAFPLKNKYTAMEVYLKSEFVMQYGYK